MSPPGVARSPLLAWTSLVPVLSVVVLALAWGRSLPPFVVGVVTALLAAAVLAAVHHAEVVAHRVGEPYGSLVLAVAVTVIEVALIVTLMIAGAGAAETLARDTVFAAVILTSNGIVGLSILVGTRTGSTVSFNAEGAGASLATVATLATLSMVVPNFTTTSPGPVFSPPQLAFAAVTALALYGLFVVLQTGRHRDYFLPVTADGTIIEDQHATPPSASTAWGSLALLFVALVGVRRQCEAAVTNGRARRDRRRPSYLGRRRDHRDTDPLAKTVAAVRAARRGRMQVSLNLAFGSAMASIGLTIPTIAVASIWLTGPLHLGLGANHIVLLALTCIVTVLTVVPGRATLLQASVHLALLAAYLFLAISP